MISKNSINNIFESLRIEEVIGDFVQLKKSGSNYRGLSPFSDERTPSFMVSPSKQIWKDFSSGKGGNAVSFLMEHEHYSYPDAIRYLGKKYQIELEETQPTEEEKQQADARESLYIVSEYARDCFADNLQNNQEGKAIGLTYFKERGFDKEIITKFQLGYAIDQWSAFTNQALKDGYELKHLEASGLTIVKKNENGFVENNHIDRFKGRVMFPIHSMSGRVLGFGGRILVDNKKAAKYLNSPESEIYNKSKLLYGIYFAKQAIAKADNCYLVEGYTDVIQFFQHNVENVISSSGTALTREQIQLVRRLTKNITILYDGDDAGIRASFRGIDLILEEGMNVRVVAFPAGEDPDSFAKNVGAEKLKEYLENESKDFINFKVSSLLKDAADDPIKKAGLIREIITSIAKIPDEINRTVYVQECARVMKLSERILFSELAQILRKEAVEATKHKGNTAAEQLPKLEKTPALNTIDELNKYELEIIRILLLYGNSEIEMIDIVEEDNDTESAETSTDFRKELVSREIYLNLQDDEIEFTDELFKTLYHQLINQLIQNEAISINEFTSHTNDKIAQLTTDIVMNDERHQLSKNWEKQGVYIKQKSDNLPKVVSDVIYNLRRILIERKIKELVSEEVSNLDLIMDYTYLKNRLFEHLNRVL